MKKHKSLNGAASFYMVAFSTLLLVIVATSFAMAIVANIERSSNDDLSQSAYDAAMAGVEDAALAYENYIACKAAGKTAATSISEFGDVNCGEIIYWVEIEPDCYMTARILGKIGKKDEAPVSVGDEAMAQSYTCVKFEKESESLTTKLTSDLPQSTTIVEFEDASAMQDVDAIVLKWGVGSSENGEDAKFGNVVDGTGSVRFFPVGEGGDEVYDRNSVPVISFQILQTPGEVTLDSVISGVKGDGTNRAMAYFVPVESSEYENLDVSGYGVKIDNALDSDKFMNTNDPNTTNQPFLVKCSDDSEDEKGQYQCEVEVGLPKLVGGAERKNLIVSIASIYGNGGEAEITFKNGEASLGIKNSNAVIDSTGRAKDLYRRVRVKLQAANTSTSGIISALRIGQGAKVDKTVTAPMD